MLAAWAKREVGFYFDLMLVKLQLACLCSRASLHPAAVTVLALAPCDGLKSTFSSKDKVATLDAANRAERVDSHERPGVEVLKTF